MAAKFLIINTKIVNEGKILEGSIFIEDQYIREVFDNKTIPETILELEDLRIIDGRGKYLLPGIIDDQVHFREPGLTQKGDLYTESKAAVAGGVTSFMDMPNTVPKATTIEVLEEKYKLASQKSLANYSFFLGATNDNFAEIEKCNATRICGVKVFMGSSTGNMLVDNPESLEKIFSGSPLLIAVHAEDEPIIQENIRIFKEKYGEDIPIEAHPLIRSEEACFKSSEKAVSFCLIICIILLIMLTFCVALLAFCVILLAFCVILLAFCVILLACRSLKNMSTFTSRTAQIFSNVSILVLFSRMIFWTAPKLIPTPSANWPKEIPLPLAKYLIILRFAIVEIIIFVSILTKIAL